MKRYYETDEYFSNKLRFGEDERLVHEYYYDGECYLIVYQLLSTDTTLSSLRKKIGYVRSQI